MYSAIKRVTSRERDGTCPTPSKTGKCPGGECPRGWNVRFARPRLGVR